MATQIASDIPKLPKLGRVWGAFQSPSMLIRNLGKLGKNSRTIGSAATSPIVIEAEGPRNSRPGSKYADEVEDSADREKRETSSRDDTNNADDESEDAPGSNSHSGSRRHGGHQSSGHGGGKGGDDDDDKDDDYKPGEDTDSGSSSSSEDEEDEEGEDKEEGKEAVIQKEESSEEEPLTDMGLYLSEVYQVREEDRAQMKELEASVQPHAAKKIHTPAERHADGFRSAGPITPRNTPGQPPRIAADTLDEAMAAMNIDAQSAPRTAPPLPHPAVMQPSASQDALMDTSAHNGAAAVHPSTGSPQAEFVEGSSRSRRVTRSMARTSRGGGMGARLEVVVHKRASAVRDEGKVTLKDLKAWNNEKEIVEARGAAISRPAAPPPQPRRHPVRFSVPEDKTRDPRPRPPKPVRFQPYISRTIQEPPAPPEEPEVHRSLPRRQLTPHPKTVPLPEEEEEEEKENQPSHPPQPAADVAATRSATEPTLPQAPSHTADALPANVGPPSAPPHNSSDAPSAPPTSSMLFAPASAPQPAPLPILAPIPVPAAPPPAPPALPSLPPIAIPSLPAPAPVVASSTAWPVPAQPVDQPMDMGPDPVVIAQPAPPSAPQAQDETMDTEATRTLWAELPPPMPPVQHVEVQPIQLPTLYPPPQMVQPIQVPTLYPPPQMVQYPIQPLQQYAVCQEASMDVSPPMECEMVQELIAIPQLCDLPVRPDPPAGEPIPMVVSAPSPPEYDMDVDAPSPPAERAPSPAAVDIAVDEDVVCVAVEECQPEAPPVTDEPSQQAADASAVPVASGEQSHHPEQADTNQEVPAGQDQGADPSPELPGSSEPSTEPSQPQPQHDDAVPPSTDADFQQDDDQSEVRPPLRRELYDENWPKYDWSFLTLPRDQWRPDQGDMVRVVACWMTLQQLRRLFGVELGSALSTMDGHMYDTLGASEVRLGRTSEEANALRRDLHGPNVVDDPAVFRSDFPPRSILARADDRSIRRYAALEYSHVRELAARLTAEQRASAGHELMQRAFAEVMVERVREFCERHYETIAKVMKVKMPPPPPPASVPQQEPSDRHEQASEQPQTAPPTTPNQEPAPTATNPTSCSGAEQPVDTAESPVTIPEASAPVDPAATAPTETQGPVSTAEYMAVLAEADACISNPVPCYVPTTPTNGLEPGSVDGVQAGPLSDPAQVPVYTYPAATSFPAAPQYQTFGEALAALSAAPPQAPSSFPAAPSFPVAPQHQTFGEALAALSAATSQPTVHLAPTSVPVAPQHQTFEEALAALSAAPTPAPAAHSGNQQWTWTGGFPPMTQEDVAVLSGQAPAADTSSWANANAYQQANPGPAANASYMYAPAADASSWTNAYQPTNFAQPFMAQPSGADEPMDFQQPFAGSFYQPAAPTASGTAWSDTPMTADDATVAFFMAHLASMPASEPAALAAPHFAPFPAAADETLAMHLQAAEYAAAQQTTRKHASADSALAAHLQAAEFSTTQREDDAAQALLALAGSSTPATPARRRTASSSSSSSSASSSSAPTSAVPHLSPSTSTSTSASTSRASSASPATPITEQAAIPPFAVASASPAAHGAGPAWRAHAAVLSPVPEEDDDDDAQRLRPPVPDVKGKGRDPAIKGFPRRAQVGGK